MAANAIPAKEARTIVNMQSLPNKREYYAIITMKILLK